MNRVISCICLLMSFFTCSCKGSEGNLLVRTENTEKVDDQDIVVPKLSRGVNFSDWFEYPNSTFSKRGKYKKQDFENVKLLGGNTIRVPIPLFDISSGAPSYILEEQFLTVLDKAVEWAESLQMYLIIDNHSFPPVGQGTVLDIEHKLIKVWSQIAQRYKNSSEYILYEIQNEPNGDAIESVWGAIQGRIIDEIRKYDTKHFLIVGSTGFNSCKKLSLLPFYEDKRLFYTFHFYDPHIFTHQGGGAIWAGPGLQDLAGLPFPYDKNKMPIMPSSMIGQWTQEAFNGYSKEGTFESLKTVLDMAVKFKRDRKVNLYCGEFGVLQNNVIDSDRVYWYKMIREYLEANHIPWTIWDYKGGFGIFNKNSSERFNYDLNKNIVEALGFTMPVQLEDGAMTDISLYKDDWSDVVVSASEPGASVFDLFSAEFPAEGDNCIKWILQGKYINVGCRFTPVKDLSEHVTEGYKLKMSVKSSTVNAKFELRFIDTKESIDDRPWRMKYDIDNTKTTFDGTWHELSIPLSAFIDSGAYDDKWYNSEGKFDWKKINSFSVVNEYDGNDGVVLYFDNIRIEK